LDSSHAFFGALETLAGVIAMSIGLTSVLAGPIEENEPLPTIATLIALTATALIFFTDLHREVPRGLVTSYSALPVSRLFDARFDLVQVSDCLTKSSYGVAALLCPDYQFREWSCW
jgi:flagellar biosynthesis protein FliR